MPLALTLIAAAVWVGLPLLSALGDRGELIRGWTDSEILFTKRCFMEYILSGVLLPFIFFVPLESWCMLSALSLREYICICRCISICIWICISLVFFSLSKFCVCCLVYSFSANPLGFSASVTLPTAPPPPFLHPLPISHPPAQGSLGSFYSTEIWQIRSSLYTTYKKTRRKWLAHILVDFKIIIAHDMSKIAFLHFVMAHPCSFFSWRCEKQRRTGPVSGRER